MLATSPPVTLPDNTVVHPNIAGATAEWIVERPRIVGRGRGTTFPTTAHRFDICVAVEADGGYLLAVQRSRRSYAANA